ncbi:hypothetical protein BpHYR1_020990 [Brachionus plicatilis]|uniref:Uncharacterized protein n=1 Tax=Brachionus plicatilis TaxID=10195 RepID=A0A3M7T1H0_BRAPC|nr:hypothetical protein BpHYR1_020990 [Brachionus plicatilis]
MLEKKLIFSLYLFNLNPLWANLGRPFRSVGNECSETLSYDGDLSLLMINKEEIFEQSLGDAFFCNHFKQSHERSIDPSVTKNLFQLI